MSAFPIFFLIRTTTNGIIAPTRSLQCALITNKHCKWLTAYCHYYICQRWSSKPPSFKITGFITAKHSLFTVITPIELSLITGSNYLSLPWLFTWQDPFCFFCNNDNFLWLPNLFIYCTAAVQRLMCASDWYDPNAWAGVLRKIWKYWDFSLAKAGREV